MELYEDLVNEHDHADAMVNFGLLSAVLQQETEVDHRIGNSVLFD